MDAERFDTLIRSLTAGSSRRRTLGVAFGGILGLRGLAAATARKRKKKCKKKCGLCRKCKKGKCKATTGASCGICRACDAAGQCVNVADNTPCDDGNLCTINDVCTNGVCGGTSTNQGQVCGTSTHGGTAIRCCNGVCADPDCLPSGTTGVSCTVDNTCFTLDCCAQQSANCQSDACFCFFAQAGEPCGSDLDCSNGAGANTACICGACQTPP